MYTAAPLAPSQNKRSGRSLSWSVALNAVLGLACIAVFARGYDDIASGVTAGSRVQTSAARFTVPGGMAHSLSQAGRRAQSSVFKTRATMEATPSQGTIVDDGTVTLTRFMIEEALKSKTSGQEDMVKLITSVSVACKRIASMVQVAGIMGSTGLAEGGGSVNVQGEEQKKLDVISNDVLKSSLRSSGKLGVIASEEEDNPVVVDELYSGEYVATFDPLDGSSNIDAAISTGTIFGVFKAPEECLVGDSENLSIAEQNCLQATLQPGDNLVAAGYCMYSSSTILVMTTGNGLNGFTLDPTIGEFILTHPNMQIPKRGKIYSMNEANYFDWEPKLQNYIDNLKKGEGQSKTKYSARYIGSMVGDVHRTLLYGGIFAYPADKKNKNGKLRLLYEAAPMSMIFEQAGGKSIIGPGERVLDVQPDQVHQRVPIFIGSPDDVDEVSASLA
mmetsp:Transcript_18779/g.33599  ORF Transcript_18779/g.33599 Transcript_18779/m.33599 type:complete len:445 (+) Transcript_18779:72-1406(+)|eukprot:CAMPEP_0197525054 /NCGR_PEP_ID=MMETSP1318-20131121/10590_1 /TAXON_ID=552666 /ORGANISM="Partenskyella glossopodia, Strain RCC365" /LENGTH=444 /DNA_ID=CAMNT_0043078213 /DNA_START=81 /DNA_END=1415 /DNA_ORIENTATION=+